MIKCNKKSLDGKPCGNRAEKDGVCYAHHPSWIPRNKRKEARREHNQAAIAAGEKQDELARAQQRLANAKTAEELWKKQVERERLIPDKDAIRFLEQLGRSVNGRQRTGQSETTA